MKWYSALIAILYFTFYVEVYATKLDLEVESMPLMFASGGYHLGFGAVYKYFRVNMTAVNAGDFDEDTGSLINADDDKTERSEKGFGIFAGYYIWKNLELFGLLESVDYKITHTASGEVQNIETVFPGIGVLYQFFIYKSLYVNPTIHYYIRSEKQITFSDGHKYTLKQDVLPLFRIGWRF